MKPSVHALGNLTKTPVLEQTKNGVATCSFTVACNGFRENDTTFLWRRAYRETAENICKFLQKGSPIYVVGELSQYVSGKGGAVRRRGGRRCSVLTMWRALRCRRRK